MRLFIAIDIPKSLKSEILKIQKEIKDLGKLTISPKENIHITLKFLGEVEKSEQITELLQGIEFEKFSITSKRIGFFPNENYIKVIWLGFKDDEPLKELQKKIDEKLSPKFSKEKNFITHATTARIKHLPFENKESIKLLKNKKIESVKFEIDSFKLMKSTLTERGPVYKIIKEFKAKSL